ncbi:MAG: ROK family protein [Parvularculaceae bacterium]|nr:ROK family protein [Parvularculaceae bacterium]
MLAGIEAGGTKFVCAYGEKPDAIAATATFPTESPEATFARCRAFFEGAGVAFDALGVAAFGPLGVDPTAADYGVVGRTPKPLWAGAGYLEGFRGLARKIVVDTDVSGAALAEQRYGAGSGRRVVAYVTVGTGVGAGVVSDGRILKGRSHYELGHIRPPHDRARDPYAGRCPAHGDCLEGLASGPAVIDRWAADLSALAPSHPAHALEADYLAHLMLTLALSHAPDVVVLGGGVAKAPGLIDKVRMRTAALIAGYVDMPEIAPPGLGDKAGVVGALALAEDAAGQG